MKYSELEKILRDAGCRIEREGSRHSMWYSPIAGQTFPVGRYKNEDVPKETQNSIFRAAGLK